MGRPFFPIKKLPIKYFTKMRLEVWYELCRYKKDRCSKW